MPVESDAMVISASIGDPERFGALFDRHATVLFRYLARRVSGDEADLLLGEVFRVAFERRETYDCERPNARPWLYGIATNLLAHHRRSEARRLHATARLLTDRAPCADPTDQVDSAIDAANFWPVVAHHVAQLPDLERDALLLFVWEDLSYEEIAAALDVPVGTVRSRLNRARLRLRELRTSSGREQ
jgi:RNA polymerase sigma-70 factor (ECF subfamily)